MSYHVHITRKATSWADTNDSASISLAEWEAYVVNDAEMRLDDHVEEHLVHGIRILVLGTNMFLLMLSARLIRLMN